MRNLLLVSAIGLLIGAIGVIVAYLMGLISTGAFLSYSSLLLVWSVVYRNASK